MIESTQETDVDPTDILSDIVVGTRFWGKQDHDLQNLLTFTQRALAFTSHLYIAWNIDADRTSGGWGAFIDQVLPAPLRPRITILPVRPWGHVTHALNTIVSSCRKHFPSCPYLLFLSVEVHALPSQVLVLGAELRNDPQTLVVGAALPGHLRVVEKENTCEATLEEDAVPWNTMALWRVHFLDETTAFPTIADEQDPPGMEEAAAIAVQQIQFGKSARRAKIISFVKQAGRIDSADIWTPGWAVDFKRDQYRLERHRIKMESKRMRTRAIWHALGAVGAKKPVIELCIPTDDN